MAPLLDAILEHVPPPPGDPQGRFAMLVTMTERDSFLGRVATGRIASGQVKVGDKIKVLRHSGELVQLCIDTGPSLCSPWHALDTDTLSSLTAASISTAVHLMTSVNLPGGPSRKGMQCEASRHSNVP